MSPTDLIRDRECVREASRRGQGWPTVREPVYRKANPVDSLHNNQQIRICFGEYTVPKPLTCGEPVEVVAQPPIRIVHNTTADL